MTDLTCRAMGAARAAAPGVVPSTLLGIVLACEAVYTQPALTLVPDAPDDDYRPACYMPTVTAVRPGDPVWDDAGHFAFVAATTLVEGEVLVTYDDGTTAAFDAGDRVFVAMSVLSAVEHNAGRSAA